MTVDLPLNPKLFSTYGIVGRREFFINFLYTLMITSPFWMLMLLIACIPKATESDGILFVWAILYIINNLIFCFLFIPTLLRRVNDIFGYVNKKTNLVISIIFLLSTLLSCFCNPMYIFLTTIIFLILQFKKGKITSTYPYDITKDFSWAAYFGTWIWGALNKSYNTLWMIPIALTPLGFIYSLICGMRGNEWASNNKDWESVDKFKSVQETQTVVFIVMQLVIIPMIITIVVSFFIFKFAHESFKDPQNLKTTIEKMDKAVTSIANVYFVKYEITKDENKFYVDPAEWKWSSYSERKKTLDFAVATAIAERSQNSHTSLAERYSKTSELYRTRIYNSQNGELLGEYYIDESIFESDKIDYMQLISASIGACRFYEPTKNNRKE